ncbi:MAG: purine/pyrimidine permease, partial [Alphaproteobacteria bacterium]|nr:purine/pyrimidine permease [Alphaproteobacteria bacterium]
VHKLRVVLPPEVTGVIVTMVGVSLVPVGVSNLVGVGQGDPTSEMHEVGLGLFTLFVMVALTIWGRGKLHLFSVLIGIVVGYALEIAFDIGVDYGQLATGLTFFEAPSLHLPTDLKFDSALLIPFLIAGLASLIKCVGDLSTAQKINDATWVTPDMKSVRGGVLADALAVVSAGLIGGMAQSTSSSNVGVSLATGVTSRYIGFSAGALFIVCAFFPVLSLIFVAIADPVKGAILIYAACFMIVSGLQLVMTRMLDARKIFVVGVAITAGLSVDMLPQLYAAVPPALQSFTTSSFSFSTVVAIVLNLIFRIGISKRATLELTPGDNGAEAVFRFLHDQGAAWGARTDVVKRATDALTEFVDVAAPMDRVGDKIRINARYDQLHLDLFLLYGGEPIELPETPPRPDAIDGDGDILRQLSGYMIRAAASQVTAARRGDLNMLHLRFLH